MQPGNCFELNPLKSIHMDSEAMFDPKYASRILGYNYKEEG